MKIKSAFLWEVIISVLTAISLVLLTISVVSPSNVYDTLFFKIDFFISLVFLFDFVSRTIIAKDKKRYWKENWLQLLASMPAVSTSVQAFQVLRILRFVRFVKVFHAEDRIINEGDKRYDGVAFQVFNIFIIVVTTMFVSSLVFFDAEYGINPNVHTFFDAIWWAFVTVTTTGYGEVYPITGIGRLVAMFLMFFGIVTFAVVIADLNKKLFYKKEKYLNSHEEK